jgi:hypothetical protein
LQVTSYRLKVEGCGTGLSQNRAGSLFVRGAHG